MFEFVNPGFVAAGAALVSLPIIIHLINRLRYKRVRWAAMEFLLKSQKRNRRRLLIEQLLLLALRCLLVLLTTLLVSRYLLAFFQPQNTLHVVVLDDSLSMTDHWKTDGQKRDSFAQGKTSILNEIARNAMQARTAQRLVILASSDPSTPRFDKRLNEETTAELQKLLDEQRPTMLRVDPLKAVEAARELFGQNALDRWYLHLVGDFRQRDWSEPEVASMNQALEGLARIGVRINYLDCAHPTRTETQSVSLFHDNLGIVELQPQTRIAAKDMPVPFTVTVANQGVGERKNLRVTIKVNGGERSDASLTMLSVPPGLTTQTFQVSFDQLGPNQVTANLEEEESGLQADNTCYAVVDVRRQIPVLVIDGAGASGQRAGGDAFHIEKVLSSARSYQVVFRGTSELEQPNLDQYASIYLLNVRELNAKGQRNLEEYLRDGGSMAFFLGPNVNPDFYNKDLYAEGKGIFPVPLADRPNPPLSEAEYEPNLLDSQPKVFFRRELHPLVARIAQARVRPIFNFLPIRRYYPVPRARWNADPTKVEELVTLPNQRSVQEYTGAAQELLDQIKKALDDPKQTRYRSVLENPLRNVRNSLGDKPLYELANALDALLHDTGDPTATGQPKPVEFWQQPEVAPLRARVERFRETVQYGDPLVVAGQYGRGRTVAFLTTAGQGWNNWGGGSPAAITYPLLIVELQNFLTTAAGWSELKVGQPLEIQVDASRYDTKVRRIFRPEVQEKAEGSPEGPVDLKEQLGTIAGGRLTFLFEEARRPGVYLFELTRRTDDGGTGRTEQRAFAFNVDPTEGDLRRISRDELERSAAGARLRIPGSGWAAELGERRSDLSESGWFFLGLLAVLLAEQALAVHLSYHLKGQEAPLPAVRAPQTTAA